MSLNDGTVWTERGALREEKGLAELEPRGVRWVEEAQGRDVGDEVLLELACQDLAHDSGL